MNVPTKSRMKSPMMALLTELCYMTKSMSNIQLHRRGYHFLLRCLKIMFFQMELFLLQTLQHQRIEPSITKTLRRNLFIILPLETNTEYGKEFHKEGMSQKGQRKTPLIQMMIFHSSLSLSMHRFQSLKFLFLNDMMEAVILKTTCKSIGQSCNFKAPLILFCA